LFDRRLHRELRPLTDNNGALNNGAAYLTKRRYHFITCTSGSTERETPFSFISGEEVLAMLSIGSWHCLKAGGMHI
jgi:hypothetical protein